MTSTPLLGSRVWAHHFSVFVPMFYLVCAIVVTEVYQLIKPRLASVMPVHSGSPIFWKESDTEKYMSFLKHEGMIVRVLRPFYQRDGKPAFYMISASYPNRLLD